MRSGEERYARDLRRLAVARRMVHFHTRTRHIIDWTGLSIGRVRLVYRQELGEDVGESPLRHRGPVPMRLVPFYQSPAARSEAGALAASFRLHGVLPTETGRLAVQRLAGLERGERLCDAYQGYVDLVPDAQFSLDQAIRLLRALVVGDELALAHCLGCQSVLVIDKLTRGAPRCVVCRSGSLPGLSLPESRVRQAPPLVAEPVEMQQSLF